MGQGTGFPTANCNDKGILSEEDVRTYEALEQDIVNLGHEIERQERLEAMEREMAAPVSDPITAKPEASKKMDTKTGTAADSYNKAFWTQVRSRNGITYEVKNALSEGVDSEGGYLVPDEVPNITRDLRYGGRELHPYSCSCLQHFQWCPQDSYRADQGAMQAWIDENGSYGESDDVFGQEQIDAHKVGTIIKVSEELLNDSAFDLEKYFQEEFACCSRCQGRGSLHCR